MFFKFFSLLSQERLDSFLLNLLLDKSLTLFACVFDHFCSHLVDVFLLLNLLSVFGLAAQHCQLSFVDIGILMLVLQRGVMMLFEAPLSGGLLLFTWSTTHRCLRNVSTVVHHAVCVLHVASDVYLASPFKRLSEHFIVHSDLEHLWVELHWGLLDNERAIRGKGACRRDTFAHR